MALIELEKGQDASAMRNLGEPADVSIGSIACRRLTGTSWPHPFAVLDEQTIVTGRGELLREVAERAAPSLSSKSVDLLLNTVASDSDLLLVVDLAAAREAGWRLPASLWDFWAAGRQTWHVLWELSQGLAISVRLSTPERAEVALACDGETTAQKVRDSLSQLCKVAPAALETMAASLTKKLEAGRMTAREADQYDAILKHGCTAIRGGKVEISDCVVWLRTDWKDRIASSLGAALDSQAAIRGDWLEAARTVDEANHGRLVTSLGGYVKAEGRFPAGAGGGTLLPAETRLSWIASLLPYFDHRDWHRDLQFHYSWNSTQNRQVTRQQLDAVTNPALGPSSTEAGFPVTHYVGVAGVGADAAELPVDHPRAGLFGYSRTPRLEDITAGRSNTLATLGVSERLGPWAAGGNATARALTKRPYVNGPDGFGSGQPNGMLAGMADGSVQFLSKDIDPHVLEQLATIHGTEKPDVAELPERPAGAATTSPRVEPPLPATSVSGKAPQPAAPTPASKTANADKPTPSSRKATGAPSPRDEQSSRSQPGADTAQTAKIDISSRLADHVREIDFPAVPLLDAVRFTSQMSTVPVTFDLDWMRALGVRLRDPVTLRLSETTTGETFQGLVASRGLTCEPSGNQLLISSPPKRRSALRTEKYQVVDLVGKDPAAGSELCEWINKLVAPDSWRAAGGAGTVECREGVLVVTQTDLVHGLVRDFCDRLRIARGKSPAARGPNETPTLATHFDQAKPKLYQTLAAHFTQPTPVAEIVAELERLSQTTILFDGVTLAGAGISLQQHATLSVDHQPLYQALMTVLQPLGLGYRIVDATTLEITTAKAAAARLEVEFYPVGRVLAKGIGVDALVERIKSQVAGATWNDAGGPGVIVVDKASNCLMVLQSQPIQAKIQILLSKL